MWELLDAFYTAWARRVATGEVSPLSSVDRATLGCFVAWATAHCAPQFDGPLRDDAGAAERDAPLA